MSPFCLPTFAGTFFTATHETVSYLTIDISSSLLLLLKRCVKWAYERESPYTELTFLP